MAGPPYVTDDPEPVEYRHWEVYLASQHSRENKIWSGTAPHVEVNYGAIPNLQLHLIAPFSYVLPEEGTDQYGYGDTEVGAKYRFIQETDVIPQVGTFLILETPTGSHQRKLGSGHLQTFLPLWLQKSFGPWTSYGGGGYWINPGEGNRNWWFMGWQAQRKMLPNVSLGAEIFHTTPKEDGGSSETKFNLGLQFDVSEKHHLLFSAGRGIQGPNRAQIYVAYQLTFGPDSK